MGWVSYEANWVQCTDDDDIYYGIWDTPTLRWGTAVRNTDLFLESNEALNLSSDWDPTASSSSLD